MANSTEDIARQFNSERRIAEGLVAYGLAERKPEVEFDPYEKLREDLILSELKRDLKGGRVLDVGSGLGHLMLRLRREDIPCEGVDLAKDAVRLASQLLRENGFTDYDLTVGDFLEYSPKSPCQAVVANGVIWYYEDRDLFLRKIRDVLPPGGMSYVIHRNSLFNLFALNEGTMNLIRDEMMSHLSPELRESVIARMRETIPGLDRAIRKHTSSALQKAYDNPLTISEMYERNGLRVDRVKSVYVHPMPPRLMPDDLPAGAFAEAQRLYSSAWQGLIMGSQFLVIAKRV